MLVTNGPVLRLCVLFAIVFGVVASASATIEIVGETQVTFAWSPPTGAVAGYHVLVSRNGSPLEIYSTVTDANSQTVYGRFGDTIRVSTAAFDAYGNNGPPSDFSEEVRFVEATGSTPTPYPTPAPTPAPGPTNPPDDGLPAGDDSIPGDSPGDETLPPSNLGPAAPYDFDGDRSSDILFRNSTTGELEFWQMNGVAVTDVIPLTAMDPRWTVAGAGDFDADGITDILWYDPIRGVVRIWLMGDFAGSGEFDVQLASGWIAAGAGDFNGDGRFEIVIWNESSRVEFWGLEDEIVRLKRISIRQGREVAGFGDVDGDGDHDVIVQDRRKRRIEAALISPDFSLRRVTIDRQRVALWDVIDSADYDGDGQDDLLWRDLASGSPGNAGVWHLWGSVALNGAPLDLNLGVDHSVLGSADYNGDGSSDLLVFDPATRELVLWLMDGSATPIVASLGTLTANWLPVGFNAADSAVID